MNWGLVWGFSDLVQCFVLHSGQHDGSGTRFDVNANSAATCNLSRRVDLCTVRIPPRGKYVLSCQRHPSVSVARYCKIIYLHGDLQTVIYLR